MGLFGPFVYESKKGVKWYLHMKEHGKRRLYYFSKDPIDALGSIPPGYEVIENPKSGMPLLRKKKGGGMFGILPGVGKEGKSEVEKAEETSEKPSEGTEEKQ